MTPDAEWWPQVDRFLVLGHVVADNGSIRPCSLRTKQAIWGSFWANAGSRSAQKLSVPLRVHLLTRAVAFAFDYRNIRLPPHQTIGQEVDTVQCKMAASILRTQRLPGEEAVEHCCRRNRAAGQLCVTVGLWSARWFARAAAWNNRLRLFMGCHAHCLSWEAVVGT